MEIEFIDKEDDQGELRKPGDSLKCGNPVDSRGIKPTVGMPTGTIPDTNSKCQDTTSKGLSGFSPSPGRSPIPFMDLKNAKNVDRPIAGDAILLWYCEPAMVICLTIAIIFGVLL